MSPLDDHLRRAMRAHADVLAPSPDPLAGIESRARAMKRRRVVATVTGAALAVAAIAVVVPSLASLGSKPSQLATQGPTATLSATPATVAAPSNVLSSWPKRGVATAGPPQAELLARFAQARNRPADQASYRPLYTGRTASGIRYTYGQAWFTGDAAANGVGYATGGTNGPDFIIGPATPNRVEVLGYLITGQPGATTDLLVVIPSPRTTQVLYDGGTGGFRPVNGTAASDGVVLVDRAFTAAGGGSDRLQLLTGNGEPAKDTIFTGTVSSLLCGLSGCG
jgi:hypothetical protein